MSICPNTGVSIPECACASCLRRQLAQFAPEISRSGPAGHDPLQLHEVRSRTLLRTVAERLRRPAL